MSELLFAKPDLTDCELISAFCRNVEEVCQVILVEGC
jgi:hypothetical protein